MDAECEKDVIQWSMRSGLCTRMRPTSTKKDIRDENIFTEKAKVCCFKGQIKQLIEIN
jgi:hypothetical protein